MVRLSPLCNGGGEMDIVIIIVIFVIIIVIIIIFISIFIMIIIIFSAIGREERSHCPHHQYLTYFRRVSSKFIVVQPIIPSQYPREESERECW